MWWTRRAYQDENDVTYCDNCHVSENEADVSYEEEFNKDLCDECLNEEEQKWGERQKFQEWLKEQEKLRKNQSQIFGNNKNNNREASIQTVFHGTDTEPGLGQRSGYYPGMYTTVNEDDANQFGKKIFLTNVDLEKIYDFKKDHDLKHEARQNGFGHHSGNGNAEVEYLKSQGFIGMKRGPEIILFDSNAHKFSPKGIKSNKQTVNRTATNKFTKLNIEIENVLEDQKEQLIKLFSMINWCGSVGASRSINIFVDGDGSFRANIKVDGKRLDGIEVDAKAKEPDVKIWLD